MTAAPDTEEIVAFLEAPDTYGLSSGEDVKRIETHASHVFLAGDRAYKMKKPVRFTFLDFSTLEKRKAACEHEVELNRRTAPEIYLGVTEVRCADGGLTLGGGDGEPVEYLVEMKRFGGEGLLATLADKGGLKLPVIEELAADVAAFHRKAEVKPGFGGAESFLKIVEGSAEDMKPSLGAVLDAETARGVTAKSRELIETHGALMDRRRDEGQVRHCHGDLHLGNVTVVDGRPVIFDCVEFNDHIARIDVFYDLAFLLMDLAFRAETDERLAGFANRALNVYLDHVSREDLAFDGLALLPLFMATRAVVRAKVTAVQAKDGAAKKKAGAYLGFAAQVLKTPAPRLCCRGWTVGHRQVDAGEGDRGADGRHGGRAASAHRYRSQAALRRRAARPAAGRGLCAGGGREGVRGNDTACDAGARCRNERRRRRRLRAGGGAARNGNGGLALRRFHRRSLARRARLRAGSPCRRKGEARRRPSDAGVEVLRKQLSYDLGEMTWEKVDASGTPAEALERAMAMLEPRQK